MNFGLFWPFFNQKQPKLTKNEENWQILNRLVKFSEIWYVDGFSTKQNATKKLFLDFGLFLPFFNQKIAKTDQK